MALLTAIASWTFLRMSLMLHSDNVESLFNKHQQTATAYEPCLLLLPLLLLLLLLATMLLSVLLVVQTEPSRFLKPFMSHE